ncbi:MAG: hypothetical protein RBQ71_04225 [Acholeplasmataceae bacterium]|jgi:hypothetical protein|nr:hypothetical protein [Acholeplasmataceae bacterium]
MKKYNNIANHMSFTIALMNVISPTMIIFFASKKSSIDTIIPMIGFACIILTGNFVYFYLLDHWYFTYYDEHKIVQKWFKKIKKVNFEEVNYLYFIGAMVIVSTRDFNIGSKKDINLKERRRILKMLKNEVCITINVYDKLFPKMLLGKCANAVKFNLGVKEKIYREMFELD